MPKVIPVVGVIGGIGSGKSSVTRRLQSLRPISVIDADQLGHQVLNLPHVQERILQRFGSSVFERRTGGVSPLVQRTSTDTHPTRGLTPPVRQGSDLQISRSALGHLVFGSDAAAHEARRNLETIVWPEIRSLIERQVSELRGETNNSGGTSLSHRRACEATSDDHALHDGQGVPPESDRQQQPKIEAIVLDAAVLLEAGWNDLCDVVVFIDTPQADRIARVQAGRGWSAAELAKREASQWPLPRKRAAADAVIDNSGSVDDAAEQLMKVMTKFQNPMTKEIPNSKSQ